jgi:hypothetical protein
MVCLDLTHKHEVPAPEVERCTTCDDPHHSNPYGGRCIECGHGCHDGDSCISIATVCGCDGKPAPAPETGRCTCGRDITNTPYHKCIAFAPLPCKTPGCDHGWSSSGCGLWQAYDEAIRAASHIHSEARKKLDSVFSEAVEAIHAKFTTVAGRKS